MIVPPGFFKDHETIALDSETTAVEVGFACGYRVLYTRNLRGTWDAHTLDIHAVFGGGATLEAAQRTMAQAVAFYLEDLPADLYIAPVGPVVQAVAS